MSFLPITKEEMTARGWEAADFVYVTGDAYVDHPSFGPAIITRLLESQGYRVAVLAQPRFDTPEDMTRFGRPRLGFLVSGGNIDSMVAHYTAARRLRSEDFYSPGCRAGLRPDRATIVYCRLLREAYGDIPIVIGGLEASLRRFAHYDYWDDAVRPSILADSGADLLIYGMGEHQMTEIAARMARGEHPAGMRDIRGTCYLCPLSDPLPENAVSCASFDKVSQDKKTYARACRLQLEEQDHVTGRAVVQKHGDLLLGRTPPVMFSQPLYAIVAIATSLIVFLLAWYWRIGFFGHMVLIDRVNNIFDALGLGVFTVIGVRAGVAAGYGENAFLCVFLGLLTGVGGGVLRDMMSREIPMVLCRRVYAIASIIGGAAYFLLRTPLQESTAALTGVILVFAIRMLATHYRWSLPRISEDQQTEPKK